MPNKHKHIAFGSILTYDPFHIKWNEKWTAFFDY